MTRQYNIHIFERVAYTCFKYRTRQIKATVTNKKVTYPPLPPYQKSTSTDIVLIAMVITSRNGRSWKIPTGPIAILSTNQVMVFQWLGLYDNIYSVITF